MTTPGYADAVGVAPEVDGAPLLGLGPARGPYDLGLARRVGSPAGRGFLRAVLWAYSGTRRFMDDPAFATWSVADHLTRAFPPALVTVGNADPLRPHSELLVERLRAHGAAAETVVFPADHRPPLGHEYQFDLETEDGRRFLERVRAFLRERLADR